MKVKTDCGHILWAGHFGINESGDQPECLHVIRMDVEEACYTHVEYGIELSFSSRCPKCNSTIESDHLWEEDTDSVDKIKEDKEEYS